MTLQIIKYGLDLFNNKTKDITQANNVMFVDLDKNMPKNIDAWDFHLKPLQKNLGVDELKITVDEKREIKEISYVDEIQNKIAIAVNKTTLSKKTDAKLFQYKTPVGAQVNEL